MRTGSAWAAVVMCLLTATTFAQDGLRSASLPERISDEAPSIERDLFRVPPDFYNRPPDPGASRLFFPHSLPTLVVPDWYVDRYRPVRIPTESHHAVRATRADVPLEVLLVPVPPRAPAPPPVPSLPGKPKTFYVIPGCYAGDKQPESDWLPAQCDISKMRVVSPQ